MRLCDGSLLIVTEVTIRCDAKLIITKSGQMKKEIPHFSIENLHDLISFPTILDHVTEPIAIADAETNAVYFNPAFIADFKLDVDEVNANGGIISVYKYPSQHSRIVALLNEGAIWDGIVEIKSDSPLLMQLHAAPIQDESGQLIAILGTCRKIPAPGIEARTLMENDIRYQGLLQSQNDLIASLDSGGRFLSVNDAFCETFGKSRAELLGHTYTPIVHPEDLQHPDEVVAKLMEKPHRLYVEQRGMTPEGWRWFGWEDFAIFDAEGEIKEIQAIGRDITDYKNAVDSALHQKMLAESLREVAESLASTLDLEEVWDIILAEVGKVVPHDTASFLIIQGDRALVSRQMGYEKYGARTHLVGKTMELADFPRIRELVEEKEPVLIPDVRQDEGWTFLEETTFIRSYVGIPIIVDGKVLAILNLDSVTPNFFHESDVTLVRLYAEHAALALKNALLYQQAHDVASHEERNRIARDLHDVVSQTIFSAKVITSSLSRSFEKNPEFVRSGLDELQVLLERALAEMRTLLFELRPTSIIKTDLSLLITQMASMIADRDELLLDLSVEVDMILPPEAQIAFYRIAHEAVSNISKHAHARNLMISLHRPSPETVHLSIRDDGRGFDMGLHDQRSLGLDIMRERAALIGASLTVRSEKGWGTEVDLLWHQELAGMDDIDPVEMR